MSDFVRFMHVERFGHSEVGGINIGFCHIFPKLDGTNSSVWYEDGEVQCGSRNQHLSLTSDNAGFAGYVYQHEGLQTLVKEQNHYRFFGEWLVPHTLKSYREDAWRRFYIFDVVDIASGKYVPYEIYHDMLTTYYPDVDYVPLQATALNASKDQLYVLAETNEYMMLPGHIGEGVVIKNYEFKNKYGRTVWAKIVRSEFKDSHREEMGVPVIKGKDMIEEAIAVDFVTRTMVEKERAKAALAIANNTSEGQRPAPIQPRLLGMVWHCILTEVIPDFVKKSKGPTIDFKLLRRFVTNQTKKYAEDLF